MKPSYESSTTKTYPSQLVVPNAALLSFRLPNYVWVVTVLLALSLLALSAVYRERAGLRQAQTSHQFMQQKVQASQISNDLLRRDIHALQHDKEVMARTAQEKLNYIRPNEVVVVLR
ncbi:MAG TPA: hypothetical protein VFZ34_24575 [Blastocatellia bacterium]|nr:hypothetical protein [Blastocatellia bacterium]